MLTTRHRCCHNAVMALDPDVKYAINRTISGTSTRLAYTCEGSSNNHMPIVCVHGGPGSLRDWRYLAPALKECKIHNRLLRFDLPGYGQSSACTDNPSSEYFAQSVWNVVGQLDAVNGSANKVILIGHSMGGHTVVEMASQHPDRVGGVIILAPVCLRPHKSILGRFYFVLKWLGVNIDAPILGKVIRPTCEFVVKRILGFPKSTSVDEVSTSQKRISYLDFHRFREQICTLQCPLLHVYTADDNVIEARVQEELAQLLRTQKNMVSVRLESGGHNLQKTRCLVVARIISDWLANVLRVPV